MPLYEFACQTCHHEFEELVFNGDKVHCPKCASASVDKRLSVPGLAASAATLPMTSGCGDPSAPPCGAPWCQRKG